MLRLAHSGRVSRWLTPSVAEAISSGLSTVEFPIPVIGTPWAVYKGEYYRRGVLTRIIAGAKEYLTQDVGAFASLDDLRSRVKGNDRVTVTKAIKQGITSGSYPWCNLWARPDYPTGSVTLNTVLDGGASKSYSSGNAWAFRPPGVQYPNTYVAILGANMFGWYANISFGLLVDHLWQARIIAPLDTYALVPQANRTMVRDGAKQSLICGIWAFDSNITWYGQNLIYWLLENDSNLAVSFTWSTSAAPSHCTMVDPSSGIVGAPGKKKGLYAVDLGDINLTTAIYITVDDVVGIIPYHNLVPRGGVYGVKGGFLAMANADGNYTVHYMSGQTNAHTLYIEAYLAVA